MRRSLISLFAGAGGLDLGLEFAGFTTIAANELDQNACESLRRNQALSRLRRPDLEKFIQDAATQKCFRKLSEDERVGFFRRLRDDRFPCLQEAKIIEGDIRDVPSHEFQSVAPEGEEIALIAGGPPCQPFSKAGKRKTLDCTKNGDLFYEFARLIRDLRPRWFLFENVKGLAFTKTDVVYSVCTHCHSKALADFHIRQNWAEARSESPPCSSCGSNATESPRKTRRLFSLSQAGKADSANWR